MFPFPGYVFTLCFLGGPRRPIGRPKKWRFRTPKKRHFLGRRKNSIFSDAEKMPFFRVRIRCFLAPALSLSNGYHISPPTGLNLESADISTSKLANSKQQMSKSIQQFLKCTLISSPLVRWKLPTQVRTLGTLWWGWELGMMQSTTRGWRSEKILVIWLAGYLAGWLAGYLAAGYLADSLAALAACLFGNWLCGCLAGYLAIVVWLAGSLADWHWLFGYLAGSLSGSLSGLPSGYLDSWLSIWLAGYLAGSLTGGTGRLVIWLAIWLAGDLAIWLAIWLAGWLPI